jgi:hypothetical protein
MNNYQCTLCNIPEEWRYETAVVRYNEDPVCAEDHVKLGFFSHKQTKCDHQVTTVLVF